jgi:hypothetical protein
MSVHYEWVIEELDGPDSDDVEIVDVTHADTYVGALKFAGQHEHARIALVRDTDRERAWAYIEDGRLPEYCEDAFSRRVARVPLRFRAQFDACQAAGEQA